MTQHQMQQSEVVYLIHFDQPYYHARHYLGTTQDLEHRLRQHASGCASGGARLIEVVQQVGITWRLACTWPGGRQVEHQLKAWNNGCRLCPICKAERIANRMFVDVVAEEDEAVLWLNG